MSWIIWIIIFVVGFVISDIIYNKIEAREDKKAQKLQNMNKQNNDESCLSRNSSPNKTNVEEPTSIHNSNESFSAQELFPQLTIQQKYAIIGFGLSMLSFAKGMQEQQEAFKMIEIEMKLLNIAEEQFLEYASKKDQRTDQDIINDLQLISDKGVLDSTLYMGFGLANVCRNEDAFNYLGYVFDNLGYSEDEMKQVIKKCETLRQTIE